MRWQGREQSENVEDTRGMRGPVMVGGGLGTLVLVLLVWLLGGDPMALLQQMNQAPPPGQAGPMIPGQPLPGDGPAEAGIDDKAKEFVSVVLKDTEDVWHQQFRLFGKDYRDPHLRVTLVLPLQRIYRDAYLCGNWAIAYDVRANQQIVVAVISDSYYRP